jgi:hypothetical protein
MYKAATAVGCCWHVQEGTSPVISEAFQAPTSSGWFTFSSSAAPGNIMMTATAFQNGEGQSPNRDVVMSSRFDDLIFTDGTGVPKAVTYYLKLDVSADVSVAAGPLAGGCFIVDFRVEDTYPSLQGSWGWGDGVNSSWCTGPGSGIFAGYGGPTLSEVLTLGPFSAMSETPVAVKLAALVGPWSSYGGGSAIDALLSGHFFARLATGQAAIVSPGFDANSAQAGIVNNFVPQLVGIDPPLSGDSDLTLAQSAPNPAIGSTRFSFTVPGTDHVRLAIYDVTGRMIAQLANRPFTAGVHQIVWDGRDAAGQRVRPGLYLYRLS